MTAPVIRLGWPASCLGPNSRTDRRANTERRAAARIEGWAEVKRTGIAIPPDAHFEITFCPPNRRRRDLDNLLASIKPHLDGMAAAAGVDDAEWSFSIRKGDVVTGGAVLVGVQPGEAWQSIGEIVRGMVKGKVE